MNGRLFGFIVVFVVVLVATGTLLQQPDREAAPVAPSKARVDVEMHQLRTTEWSSEGAQRYQLTANAMQHHPERAETTLDTVEMHFNSATGTPWLIRAPAATSRDDGSRIELHGEVLMRRDPAAGHPDREGWLIETADITIHPQRQQAKSTAPITITHGTNRTTAVGMTADFSAAGRLLLHREIRSNYVQPN